MLRKQTPGKQKPWTEDQLKAGLEKFFEIHKKYPTAEEVDEFKYLPTARSIQRNYSGLISLRKKLKLKSQKDFRSGKYASKRSSLLNSQNKKSKIELYELLKKMYDENLIEMNYFHTDDGRIHTDFYIRSKKGHFGLDVINATSRHSLIGCINSKVRSLENREPKIPMILLINNKDIDQGEIEKILKRKKNKLPGHCRVESINNLREALKKNNT